MKSRESGEPSSASDETTVPQDIARQDAASFEVYRKLRDDIVCCRLRPDERLRFDALRKQYGAGVGTLREALSHLVSDGLVRTEAGRGFRVAPVSISDLMDITEWRVEFEVRAIRQSIERGDDAWEAEIVTAGHMLMLAGMPALEAPAEVWHAYGQRHKRFHDALTAACGSPWLLHFRSILFDQARRYQALAVLLRELKVFRKEEDHRSIMKAVLERNADKAAQLIEQHVRRTADVVQKELAAAGSQVQMLSLPPTPRRRKSKDAATGAEAESKPVKARVARTRQA